MPEQLDAATLELLERQLADRVVERARASLFKLYAVAGSAVVAVLGLVGYNLLDEAKRSAEDNVAAAVAGAQQTINDLDKQISIKLGISNELSEHVSALVTRSSNTLEAFQPKVQRLNELGEQLDQLVRERADLETRLGQAQAIIAQVEKLPATVAQLGNTLQELSNALAERAARLDNSADGSAADGVYKQRIDQVSKDVGSVISAAKELGLDVQTVRGRPTVYFQFAGAQRSQAEELSTALRKAGYPVPGEDREAGAAGKQETRYFYEEDAEAARKLAEDTSQILHELGYNIRPVEAKSLVTYRGIKPRPGVIELWLELPARSSN